MNVLRYHRLRLNLTPKRWLSTVNGGRLSERLLKRLKSSEPEVISSSGEALGRRQVASSNLLDTLNLVVTDQKHSQKGHEKQKQRYKKRKEKQKQRKPARNNEPTSAPSEVVTPDQIAELLSNLPLVQDVAEASDGVLLLTLLIFTSLILIMLYRRHRVTHRLQRQRWCSSHSTNTSLYTTRRRSSSLFKRSNITRHVNASTRLRCHFITGTSRP